MNENQETNGMPQGLQSANEIALENMKENKKQARMTRFMMIFTGGLFVVFLVAALIIVPPVLQVLNGVNRTLDELEGTIVQANNTLDDVGGLIGSVKKTSDNLNQLVEDNAEQLSDSMGKISSIDFETLNSAIKDLETSVGPLAKFASMFG